VTEYLDLDDLLAAANVALGKPPQVRDVGILLAAVARPQATAFGDDAYPTLDHKAAALIHALVTGHPLVDGNKRLGWVAVRLFYRLSGDDIHPTPDEAFDLVMAIADTTLDDVSTIAGRFASWRLSG
jgi:death on curing protein